MLPRASRSHVPRSQRLRRRRSDALSCCFRLRVSPFNLNSFSPYRMELGMRSRPRLHRSGDPATNPHSCIRDLTDRRSLALLPSPSLPLQQLSGFSPYRMDSELGMRSRPRLHRSGDPATNPHSGIRELTALPWAFGPAASPRAAAPRFSVPPAGPTFGSNAECAFPLHLSDSALCFSALPACQTD
jgi:hypothetical protein